jgi:hypothetical protein
MGIAEQLNAIRRDFEGCRLATFADLSSGIVLFASAEGRVPQEHLEALGARARTLLSQPAVTGLLPAPIDLAVAPEDEGLLVIVRAPQEPDEALVFRCDDDIDLASFMARAARDLAALGTGQE